MLTTFLDIVHVFVCLFLIFVVLLQQGRGGGMGAALGGGAAQQVFGGRGAGNLLTRATAICATIFMLTSVSLAYLSSSGDRALRDRVMAEEKKKAEPVPRPKETSAKDDEKPAQEKAGGSKDEAKPSETNAVDSPAAPKPSK
jgi:preprotein translocase subunit SecG